MLSDPVSVSWFLEDPSFLLKQRVVFLTAVDISLFRAFQLQSVGSPGE